MMVKIIIKRSRLLEQSVLLSPANWLNQSFRVSLAEPQSSHGEVLDAGNFVSQLSLRHE
jgi:hypothetical protein